MAKTSGADQVIERVERLKRSLDTVASAVEGMRENVGSLAKALGAMAKQTRAMLDDHEQRLRAVEAAVAGRG